MSSKLKTLKPRIGTLPERLATVKAGSWRAGKATAAERGYGARWQKARLRHLSNHPLCLFCQAKGLTRAATVVDHITPHRGDQQLFWDERNWQSLCASCHSGEKARIENGKAAKGCGPDGWPWARGDGE